MIKRIKKAIIDKILSELRKEIKQDLSTYKAKTTKEIRSQANTQLIEYMESNEEDIIQLVQSNMRRFYANNFNPRYKKGDEIYHDCFIVDDPKVKFGFGGPSYHYNIMKKGFLIEDVSEKDLFND